MGNIGQKKKPCEEKNIFAPKFAFKNAFKKCGGYLLKCEIQEKC